VEKRDFKILIAEDDGIVRDVILKFLTDQGYTAVVAKDGLDAIRILRMEDIKLVLTDLRMPGADGMEVLRTAVRINPRISVVLLTAYGTLDTALEAMKEGAYDYIVKPFVMQQLLLIVRNAYKMADLIEENDELAAILRDTYRNLEVIGNIGTCGDKKIIDESAERIERLGQLKVIGKDEAASIRERLTSGTGDENLKKYNSLVNYLNREGVSVSGN
jgi:DNA-binding NtrC family response regulator